MINTHYTKKGNLNMNKIEVIKYSTPYFTFLKIKVTIIK